MRTTFDQFRLVFPERACLDILLEARLGGREGGPCGACAGAPRLDWRARTQTFTCGRCGFALSPRAGTPFGKLNLPLTEWFFAVSLAAGPEAQDLPDVLARELGRSLRTTTRMAREARALVGRGERPPPPWAPLLTARIAARAAGRAPGLPAGDAPEPRADRRRLRLAASGVAALAALGLGFLLLQAPRPRPAEPGPPPSLLVEAGPRPSVSLQEVDFDPGEILAQLDRLARERVGSYQRLVDDAAAPGPHKPDEVLRFGAVGVPRALVQEVVRAARRVGADPVTLMAIADKESSFRPDARARTSSATGLYQFIESTWLKAVRDFGARHGLEREAGLVQWQGDALAVADPNVRRRILDLRLDPYLSAVLAAETLKADSARIAQRIGRPLTTPEIYLAHFLGPEGAVQLLTVMAARPDSTASDLMPRPAKANRQIFYGSDGGREVGLSVAEVHRKLELLMQARLRRYHGVGQAIGETRSLRLLPLAEALVPPPAVDRTGAVRGLAADPAPGDALPE